MGEGRDGGGGETLRRPTARLSGQRFAPLAPGARAGTLLRSRWIFRRRWMLPPGTDRVRPPEDCVDARYRAITGALAVPVHWKNDGVRPPELARGPAETAPAARRGAPAARRGAPGVLGRHAEPAESAVGSGGRGDVTGSGLSHGGLARLAVTGGNPPPPPCPVHVVLCGCAPWAWASARARVPMRARVNSPLFPILCPLPCVAGRNAQRRPGELQRHRQLAATQRIRARDCCADSPGRERDDSGPPGGLAGGGDDPRNRRLRSIPTPLKPG